MLQMIMNILRATEEEALAMRIPELAFDGDDVAVAEVTSLSVHVPNSETILRTCSPLCFA